MNKLRLGVNIDHVATVRNARGELYPSPLRAALLAQKNGADSVTIHLREDRRHINEQDLKKIKNKLKIPLNLEIAATAEMLKLFIAAIRVAKIKSDNNRNRENNPVKNNNRISKMQ